MANMLKECFFLKIVSSQFKRFNLAVGESSILWYGYWCKIVRKARFWSAFIRSLCAVVRLCCHTTQTVQRKTRPRPEKPGLIGLKCGLAGLALPASAGRGAF